MVEVGFVMVRLLESADHRMAPTASIIIPAFNAALFISTALQSVAGQTEADIEIIVVDDGSSDGTPGIVEDWARRDERIRLIQLVRNGGAAHARNVGNEVAQGRWIAILDADDAFAPTRIATLVTIGEETQADLVADNLLLIDYDAGRMIGPAFAFPEQSSFTEVDGPRFIRSDIPGVGRRGVGFGFLKPIFRRRFLTAQGIRYREHIKVVYDFVYTVECLAAGGRLVIANAALYEYAIRAGSLSHSRGGGVLAEIIEADRGLLEDPIIRANRPIYDALIRRQRPVKHFIVYCGLIAALREKRVLKAAALFAGGWRALPAIARYASLSTTRRLSRPVRPL